MGERRILRAIRAALGLGLGLAAALIVFSSVSFSSSLAAAPTPPAYEGIIWEQADWSRGPEQTTWLHRTRYHGGTTVGGLSDPGTVALAMTGTYAFCEEFTATTYMNITATTANWNTILGRLELPQAGEESAAWGFQDNPQVGTNLHGVFFADAYTGWAVGKDGTVVHTADGGTSWNTQDGGTNEELNGLFFVDANTGWAVGTKGTIIATTDGGVTWDAQASGTNEDLNGVSLVDANTGWAVGKKGTIIATTDGGATWHAQASGTNEELRGVHFVDTNTGWAAGEKGTIIATTDGGATWHAQASGTNEELRGVHFVDTNTGWAAGEKGTILVTIDGGTNWSPQTSGTSEDLDGVYFVDATTGWAVGKKGAIIKYSAGYVTTAEAQSLNVNATSANVVSVTLTADETLNDETIVYSLSNSGGTDWFEVESGVSHVFTTTGSDMRWRAVLSTTDPALTPFVESLCIRYQTAVTVVYQIGSRVGDAIIVVRVRMENGQPVILSWEFLP